MRIDRGMNLVFPVLTAKHGTVHVHSTPVSRSVFEMFYDVLGRVFTQCLGGEDPKFVALAAPQTALPALKDIAKRMGRWEGTDGVQSALLNEIIRLTNVIVPTSHSGYETVPMYVAIQKKILDEDDEAEALSAIVFFCAVSKVAPKELSGSFLEMAAALREWQFTSSGCTEFASSLVTSTVAEATSAMTSSVIS